MQRSSIIGTAIVVDKIVDIVNVDDVINTTAKTTPKDA
jgi:hypothetical protein